MVCKLHDDQTESAAFDLALDRHGGYNNARYVYSTHFTMDQDQWDEGWGWSKHVYNRPFGKMLGASYILERGIGAFPGSTNSLWSRAALAVPAPPVPGQPSLAGPVCALKVRQAVMTENELGRELHMEMSHAFVTSRFAHLMHYYEAPAAGAGALQFLSSDATALAGPGPTLLNICALADEAVPEPGAEAWCYGRQGRPAVLGAVDPKALIWVFGRSITGGEVIVYWIDWHAAAPQWRTVDLSTVLRTSAAPNFAGIDEVPAVVKQGTPAGHRIDIVVRNGYTLYHMWHEGSNDDAQTGWQAENVTAGLSAPAALASQLQVRTRPAVAADLDGRRIHVFARNENGALMQYTYTLESVIGCGRLPFPTFLPCRGLPASAWWWVRNVDNELEGRPLGDIVPHANVSGPISAVTANSGAIHVFQHKTDGRRGLYHYVLEDNVWRRDEWWPESMDESLVGEPCIVANDQPAFRQDDFPFDLYVANVAGSLYGFQHLQGIDEWWRENLRREAAPIQAAGTVPAVQERPAATLTRFEEWVVRNVVARSGGAGGELARYVWVDRSGWRFEGLTSAGWRAELVAGSGGSLGAPAVNDFQRVLDAYTYTTNEFVRYRLTRDRPWHASRDYYNWASGQMHDFDYRPEDELDRSPARVGGWWHIYMRCGSFNQSSGPADRAGYMLHEATHNNEHFRGTFSGWAHHELNGEDADYWHWHSLWEIEPGALDPAHHKHSMYQIQIEFLADMGEFPAPELAWSFWSGLAGSARQYMSRSIIDIPPWTPGLPRPL